MYFSSDNSVGASEKILQRVIEAMREGPMPSYGGDDLTKEVERQMALLFEHDVAVFLVPSGTAANALALAHITPPWGAIFAHEEGHIVTSECGSVEFYSTARIASMPGINGKIAPAQIEALIGQICSQDRHGLLPGSLSLTNLTEVGTCYLPQEIKALTTYARSHGMKTHLDGARFANALAFLECKPADLTWRAGIDVMSFGATKNGAIAAEAIVFFDPDLALNFKYRRLRAGHLISKHRFIAAQFLAWLEGGHWLELAVRANAVAARLAQGLQKQGIELAFPCDGNEVFAWLPHALEIKLREKGAVFHSWVSRNTSKPLPKNHTLSRFVCAFNTQESEVDKFLEFIK
jgi:threonine aldolase